MNRFDDAWRWKIFEKFLGPLLAAILTAAVIWGSVKQQIEELVKADCPTRITRLETQYVDIDKKLDRVLDKLDR